MSLERFGLVWIRQNFGPYLDRDGNYLEFETKDGVYVPIILPGMSIYSSICHGYELRAKDGPVRRKVKV